jgi:hypothetical protein
MDRKTNGQSPSPACSALVTRYPTGCFGIGYAGATFWKLCMTEAEVHEELAALKLPKRHVKWEEKYYDRRYEFNDPRSYRTRKFIPQNAPAVATAPKNPD